MAEFAVALPAIVIVLALGIGALGATARGVRLQDAVSDAARLAARGESADRVHAVVAAAVDDATATIEHRDDIVCITARAPVAVLTLTATGCALAGGG
ncbi:TadE family type IV pilus minor pilin [Microbacterium aurantiacum]|uniref:TadE family type IV pilus minor pilin n=1 Tax=Microbacterium aurantiacum TaxID=162393 RepID=UPI001E4FB312|nr:TadE family type IV pilus minor pilin [Microbacterium chocolatum]